MKKGSKMTEEQRKKLSEAHKGQISWSKGKKLGKNPKHSEFMKEHYRVHKNPFLEKHHSEESKRKMSETHKGISPWNKGKTNVYSEETKRRMGVKNIGRTSPMKGKSHSEETKKKLSQSIKKTLSNLEWRQRRSKMVKSLWRNPKYRKQMSESAKSSINEGRFRRGHEFSKEIKQKIREYTLSQYESRQFPKQADTKPERMIKKELLKRGYKEGIDFIHQFKFMNKFMCDFCFPSQKVILEVDGDFWHGNPDKYSQENLHKHQLKGIARDKSKNAYIRKVDNGSWKLIRIWESDIKEDISKCVDRIEEVLKRKN